jgi:F420-non-reducing hydrogenase iron-sulfur subunit
MNSGIENKFRPKLTLFHCINSLQEEGALSIGGDIACDITAVKMACSSMVKDVFLLKAFEAGADGVLVFVCPEGMCRYVEGNIRAAKRVDWVKHLLDEIGLDGRRLDLFHPNSGDGAAADIVQKTVSILKDLGPNPAA